MAKWPEFDFKVGDVICRDKAGRPMVVTAVGKKRFLYIPICANAQEERVAQKIVYCLPFRRWDPSRYPDRHYSYVQSIEQHKYSLLKEVTINWPTTAKGEKSES